MTRAMTALDNWQKSSFSGGGDGDNCLELAATPTTLHLRESEDPAATLSPTPITLANLLEGIRAGSVQGLSRKGLRHAPVGR